MVALLTTLLISVTSGRIEEVGRKERFNVGDQVEVLFKSPDTWRYGIILVVNPEHANYPGHYVDGSYTVECGAARIFATAENIRKRHLEYNTAQILHNEHGETIDSRFTVYTRDDFKIANALLVNTISNNGAPERHGCYLTREGEPVKPLTSETADTKNEVDDQPKREIPPWFEQTMEGTRALGDRMMCTAVAMVGQAQRFGRHPHDLLDPHHFNIVSVTVPRDWIRTAGGDQYVDVVFTDGRSETSVRYKQPRWMNFRDRPDVWMRCMFQSSQYPHQLKITRPRVVGDPNNDVDYTEKNDITKNAAIVTATLGGIIGGFVAGFLATPFILPTACVAAPAAAAGAAGGGGLMAGCAVTVGGALTKIGAIAGAAAVGTAAATGTEKLVKKN